MFAPPCKFGLLASRADLHDRPSLLLLLFSACKSRRRTIFKKLFLESLDASPVPLFTQI